MRALLSVSDKSGLVDFARQLSARGVELISTGGTARALRDAGLVVADVSDVTRFPEMLDGRVKTLHPAVHGGLLARRDLAEHMAAIAEHGIAPIDLVVVNLYPFRETAARPDVAPDDVIEQIDIGGPSMLRSAAKNFDAVTVVVDPSDYGRVLDALGDDTDGDAARRLAFRRSLAAKVFAHTAAYDAAIAAWFAEQENERFPERLSLAFERAQALRYGENPQQRAAFYVERAAAGSARSCSAAARSCRSTTCSTSRAPCSRSSRSPTRLWRGGSAARSSSTRRRAASRSARRRSTRTGRRWPAIRRARSAPSIAFTAPVDDATAEAFGKPVRRVHRRPVVLGRRDRDARPQEEPARARGARRRRPSLARRQARARRPARAGSCCPRSPSTRLAGRHRAPADRAGGARPALRVARRGERQVERDRARARRGDDRHRRGADVARRRVVPRRVTRRAQAGHPTAGAVLASDAFFPFRDGVDHAAAAGVRAIVQPGGSVRDAEVIAAANEHGIAMVFTGTRLFRH